jgi:hypothetical protein
MGSASILYRAIEIWKPISARKVIRYRCFELLTNGRYWVQGADVFTLPVSEAALMAAQQLTVEQFAKTITSPPRTYASLDEAIFEYDFESELLWNG